MTPVRAFARACVAVPESKVDAIPRESAEAAAIGGPGMRPHRPVFQLNQETVEPPRFNQRTHRGQVMPHHLFARFGVPRLRV